MARHRRYEVFITRNSEFHLLDDVCCGVRDRRTGHWVDNHPALGIVLGGVLAGDGMHYRELLSPAVGECLVFRMGSAAFRTSEVMGVETHALP